MSNLKIINGIGSKVVNIQSKDGRHRATYCQVYKGEEQVLNVRTYSSLKRAEAWGRKQLGF